MDQNIKEIIKKVKNMERGNLLGIKDHIIKDNSLWIIFMGLDFIVGMIKELIKGLGKIIRCVEKEYLNG